MKSIAIVVFIVGTIFLSRWTFYELKNYGITFRRDPETGSDSEFWKSILRIFAAITSVILILGCIQFTFNLMF